MTGLTEAAKIHTGHVFTVGHYYSLLDEGFYYTPAAPSSSPLTLTPDHAARFALRETLSVPRAFRTCPMLRGAKSRFRLLMSSRRPSSTSIGAKTSEGRQPSHSPTAICRTGRASGLFSGPSVAVATVFCHQVPYSACPRSTPHAAGQSIDGRSENAS